MQKWLPNKAEHDRLGPDNGTLHEAPSITAARTGDPTRVTFVEESGGPARGLLAPDRKQAVSEFVRL
jgi:hypothetical protein